MVAVDNESEGIGVYMHFYNGDSLKKVLTGVARDNGNSIHFASDLKPSILNSRVTGKFAVSNNQQLLNKLGNQFGFDWYDYSGITYITSKSTVNKDIEIAHENMPSVEAALNNAGLINRQFGYTEMPSQDKVIVSGPTEYVNLLSSQIQKLRAAPSAQQFAVYHLKYASATDITLSFNNQSILIPGVASILRYLLTGSTKISENAMLSPESAVSTTDAHGGSTSGSLDKTNGPLIEADDRLNTVIIRDKTANLKLYAKLIEALDTPAPLIQVDVIEISLNDDKLNDEGVNWWGANQGGTAIGVSNSGLSSGNGSSGTAISNNISSYLQQLSPGNILVSNFSNFIVSLQALEQRSLARTVNRPSLVTIDNLPAIMSNTQTLYITLPTSNVAVYNTTSSSSGAVTQAQVNTALSITPHVIKSVNGKNEIKLTISLQSGDITNPTTAPTTNQNTINSQAVINEGQSLLLAGYTQSVMEHHVSQVPGLGSIPLLGWFFRSTSDKNTQETKLYLITPKIVWPASFINVESGVTVNHQKISVPKNVVESFF